MTKFVQRKLQEQFVTLFELSRRKDSRNFSFDLLLNGLDMIELYIF